MAMNENYPNEAKRLREMVLYICQRSEGDEAFGSVKLNKILFYSDFARYGVDGSSVTGQEYQRLKNGPAPRAMKPLLDEMTAVGELVIAQRSYYGRPQKRPVALREAELSEFSAWDIAIVDKMISRFWCMNAAQISDESHKLPAWELAEEGETIPYSSVLLARRDLTQSERQWAHDLDMSGVEDMLAA